MNNVADQALEVFKLVVETLDKRKWRYKISEEDRSIYFGVNGDDLDMFFRIKVYDNPDYVAINSWLPSKIRKDDITEAAMLITAINYTMSYGAFDMDITSGEIIYRQTFIYTDCVFSTDLIEDFIDTSVEQVDKVNDKIDAFATGRLSLTEVLEELSKNKD